jgi:uncharacterized coiled-coil DUF342 family protein
MPDASNPTILALIGTVMGGSGLKIVESFLSKRKTQNDEATAIRGELRTEVDNLRKLIKDTEAEVDEWRNKYYTLVNEVAQIRADAAAAAALAALKAKEAEDARKALANKPAPRKRAPRKAAPKKEVE